MIQRLAAAIVFAALALAVACSDGNERTRIDDARAASARPIVLVNANARRLDTQIAAVEANGSGFRWLSRAGAESDFDVRPQWSPAGKRVAFERRTANRLGEVVSVGVHVVSARGTRERRVATGFAPSWSPNGQLVFVESRSGDELATGRIVVYDEVRRRRRTIARGTFPTWSPRGGRVAFMRYVEGERDLRSAAVLTIAPDGSRVRELLRIDRSGRFGALIPSRSNASPPAWSADGRTIAIPAWDRRGRQRLLLVNAATGAFRDALPPGRLNGEFAWSPKARQIAFSTSSPTTAGNALAVVEVESRRIRVLSRSQFGSIKAPAWSLDGNRVAFVLCESERCELRVVAAAGSRSRRVRALGFGFDDAPYVVWIHLDRAVDWGG